MVWKLLALPFRIAGLLLTLVGRIGRFAVTNMLGTIIVATIGFVLGMKYVEDRKDKRQ